MTSTEEARDKLLSYLTGPMVRASERYKGVRADLWQAFGTSPDDTEEDRRRMLRQRPGERNEQEEWSEFLEGMDVVQFVTDELWPPSEEERERRAKELFDKTFGRTHSDRQ